MDDDSIFFKYTIEDAENDGVLFKIFQVNPDWERGIFSHVTTNLLSYGYEEGGIINLPNLIDLLNQSLEIVKKASKNFENYDYFFSGEIELPSGQKQKIFIQANEIGKFTIMLLEDY
ncbi:MAG: hypothetical protein KC589_06675 [Nanoarchaeota archaeon]|nr:hypothetical protein [Nanoarchaeota archaeon]